MRAKFFPRHPKREALKRNTKPTQQEIEEALEAGVHDVVESLGGETMEEFVPKGTVSEVVIEERRTVERLLRSGLEDAIRTQQEYIGIGSGKAKMVENIMEVGQLKELREKIGSYLSNPTGDQGDLLSYACMSSINKDDDSLSVELSSAILTLQATQPVEFVTETLTEVAADLDAGKVPTFLSWKSELEPAIDGPTWGEVSFRIAEVHNEDKST